MEDIQGMWEVPSIAHFCSLFRTAFNLLDFDIEELEEALLLDGVEDLGSPLLQELIVRLLSGCFEDENITKSNYEMYLRRLFRQKNKECGCHIPFEGDSSFQFFPLHVKVITLQMLCDFRLDAEDVQDVLKNLEADSLRVEPLGYDSEGAAYWYFYGTRLYKEDPEDEPPLVDKKRKGNSRKKKPPSKWYIVCYEEEDWTDLTKKLGNSSSKQDKALYRILKEDFLPEIPTLFEEKEKQRLKRMKDAPPPRKATTRSGLSESVQKSQSYFSGYSGFDSRVKPSNRSSDSNISDNEEEDLEFESPPPKAKSSSKSTLVAEKEVKKPVYTSESELSELEIIPEPKKRGSSSIPKPVEEKRVVKTKGAVKQMVESPKPEVEESDQENRKPVKTVKNKKKQKRGKGKKGRVAKKVQNEVKTPPKESVKPEKVTSKKGNEETELPAQSRSDRKSYKSDFDSDMSYDEIDDKKSKNLGELDNLLRTKTRPRYQDFYTDSEEEVLPESKVRGRSRKRKRGEVKVDNRTGSQNRRTRSKRQKSKLQDESETEEEVLQQKIGSPTPSGRLKGRQTNNSLSTTIDPDILCAAFATLEEDVKTWTDKKKQREVQKEVKRLQMEMEKARSQNDAGKHAREQAVKNTRERSRSPSPASSVEDIAPQLINIVDKLRAHEDAYPFLDSVDEEFAPDYYAKILNPMDLQRMKMKAQTGHYEDLDEFVSDFFLIPDNCKQYYGSDSDYYEMAKTLETLFERQMAKEFKNYKCPVRRSKTPARHHKKDKKKSHKKKKKREKHREEESRVPHRKSRNRSSYKEISDSGSESDGVDERDMLPRKSDIYTSSDSDDGDVKAEEDPNPLSWLERKSNDKASALEVLVASTAKSSKDSSGSLHWAKKLSQAYQEHARQDKEGYFSDNKLHQEEDRDSGHRSPRSPKKPKSKKTDRKAEKHDRRPFEKEKPKYNRNVIPKQPELDNVIMKLKETRTALQQQRRTNDDTSTLNLGSILSEKSEKDPKSPETPPEVSKPPTPVPVEEKPKVESSAHKATPNLSAWFKAFGNQKAAKAEPAPLKSEPKASEPLNLRSFLPSREDKLTDSLKIKLESTTKKSEPSIPSSLSFYEEAAKKVREVESSKAVEPKSEPKKVTGPEVTPKPLEVPRDEQPKLEVIEPSVEPPRVEKPVESPAPKPLPTQPNRNENQDSIPLVEHARPEFRTETPKIDPFRSDVKSERKIQTAVVSPLQRVEAPRQEPSRDVITSHPSPSHVQLSALREPAKFSNPPTPVTTNQSYEKLSESQLQDLRNMYAADSPQPQQKNPIEMLPDRGNVSAPVRQENRLEEHLASLRNAYQGAAQPVKQTKQDRLEDHLESLRKVYQNQPVQNPPKPLQTQVHPTTSTSHIPDYSNYAQMAQKQAYPNSLEAQKYLEMSALAMSGYRSDFNMATRQQMYQQYSNMMQHAQAQKVERSKEAERQVVAPQYPGRSDVNPYALDHLNRLTAGQNLDISRSRMSGNKPASTPDVYQGLDPYEAARSAAAMNRAQMGMSALAGLNEMNALQGGIGQVPQQSSSKGLSTQQIYGNPAFDNSSRYAPFRLPDPSSALYHHYLQQNPDFLLKNPAHSQLLQQSLLNASMNPNMRFPPAGPYQQRWT